MLVNRNAVVIGALLAGIVSAMQGQAAPSKPAKTQAALASNSSSSQDLAEGQRVLQQNCTRCHNAPEGLTPRITKTVVRHMRVRAQLSKHDEEELLRFLAP